MPKLFQHPKARHTDVSGGNLDEVVEDAEALWVLAGLDVHEVVDSRFMISQTSTPL
jgi:hypothetical protein